MSIDKLHSCLDCLRWVFQETEKRGIEHVIFAGDLFHDRHKINTYAYDQTYQILSEFGKKMEIYLLIGNHDMYYRTNRNISSIKPFREFATVIEEPQTLNVAGLSIDFMPYTENPVQDLKKSFPKRAEVLVGHLALAGATLNTLSGVKYRTESLVEDIEEVPQDALSSYRKVFLGHFHARQQVSPEIEYLGSPLQLSYGEAMDKKGFTILDTDTLDTEFVENTKSPRYFIIPSNMDISEFDVKDGYVRIITDQSSRINLIEMKEKISEQFHPRSLEIIPVKTEETENEISGELEGVEDFHSNVTDIIQQYSDSIDTELDKKQLIEVGIEIIRSGDSE